MINLVRQLYPTGRAFRIFTGSNFEKLHGSLNDVMETFKDEVKSIYDSLLPDNDNFTAEDATIWEKRLGLTGAGTLEDRKKAIMRKLNHPGNTRGRLSRLFLEGQLRAAGFDVYVHANWFPDGLGGFAPINPGTGAGSYTAHGAARHGISVHGTSGFPYESIIANHVNKALEPSPVFTPDQLKYSFFIGGQTFPNTATVPAAREKEFRKLILTLKGSHMVGYLLINYV
jgi:hypothetical protein